jgi:hypothetical protein
MKAFMKIFKEHPIAVIAYCTFTVLCVLSLVAYWSLKTQIAQYPNARKGGREYGGVKEYGVAALTCFYAFIFFVVNFFLGIVRNEQISFYMGLCLGILVQTIILLNLIA